MSKKTASSQASYAVLSEGVHSARIEAHRIRHMINRALKIIEKSDHKEHLYQLAGDLIMGFPTRLDMLDQKLDKASYALALLGKDFLQSRLPLMERDEVDEAVRFGQPPFGGSGGKKGSDMAQRVTRRFLASDEE